MEIESTTAIDKTAIVQGENQNLPWVEKYRPTDLEQLISHQEVMQTLTRLTDANKLPHLLLYGPPGTGKTTTVLAIARRMYGKNYKSMILELNASDERGIDVVRDQIKDFANTRNIFSSGLKLIILDEADAMTSAAQAALRRVMEKHTKTTRFCLICNYLNNLIPAIQSRCTRFRFGPLNDEDVTRRLREIVKIEGVDITPEGLAAVVKLGRGDMRKSLNILQSAHMSTPHIDEGAIYTCTGHPLPGDINKMLGWLLNEDYAVSFANIRALQTEKGLALQDIITEIHAYVLQLDLDGDLVIYLLDKLAEIEFRTSLGTSEKLNLGAIVGYFQHVREKVFKAAK